MKNELAVFKNERFGEVRTLKEDDKVLFCGSDVAKALGYSNPWDAIQRHCRTEGIVKREGVTSTTNQYGVTTSQTNMMTFITEGNLYRLIAHSKLPAAEQFERWVFDEVIPSIRRTGGYVANEDMFLNTYLPHADEPTRAMFHAQLQVIRSMDATIARQQAQLEEQQPKVDFANRVACSSGLVTMSEFAKMVQDADIPLGRNKLAAWLRDKGYLRDNNEPYQRFVTQGLFQMRETIKSNKVYPVTLITGKGQTYLFQKLRDEFVA